MSYIFVVCCSIQYIIPRRNTWKVYTTTLYLYGMYMIWDASLQIFSGFSPQFRLFWDRIFFSINNIYIYTMYIYLFYIPQVFAFKAAWMEWLMRFWSFTTLLACVRLYLNYIWQDQDLYITRAHTFFALNLFYVFCFCIIRAHISKHIYMS